MLFHGYAEGGKQFSGYCGNLQISQPEELGTEAYIYLSPGHFLLQMTDSRPQKLLLILIGGVVQLFLVRLNLGFQFFFVIYMADAILHGICFFCP